MGTVQHKYVVITLNDADFADREELEAQVNRLPAELRVKLRGPYACMNGYVQYFLPASGSNKGWPTAFQHECDCALLLETFREAVEITEEEGEVTCRR